MTSNFTWGARNFNPENHPICGPILRGGPAGLTRKYHVEHEEEYFDECYLCYSTRLKLRRDFLIFSLQIRCMESEKQYCRIRLKKSARYINKSMLADDGRRFK